LENGNAYNSAAHYDIGTKFGLQVEDVIQQRTTELHGKPEVKIVRGSHI